jgi:hypothetical protein
MPRHRLDSLVCLMERGSRPAADVRMAARCRSEGRLCRTSSFSSEVRRSIRGCRLERGLRPAEREGPLRWS